MDTRLVIDPAAMARLQEALAHGFQALGEEIAHDAASRIPTGTPTVHMRNQWGVASFVDDRQVESASADGSAVARPNHFQGGGPTCVVGFGGYYSNPTSKGYFSARYLEFGTSDTPAEPFLTPAAQSASGKIGVVQAAVREHLR